MSTTTAPPTPDQADTTSISAWIEDLARRSRAAGRVLGVTSEETRNLALNNLATALEARPAAVLEANARDIAAAEARGTRGALLDRLRLTPSLLTGMAQSVREIRALPDPVGQVAAGWRRPNGLEIQEVRVPLGVVGVVYESRPNVTVDVTALCLKSGNAVILKGGSDALNSNRALVALARDAIAAAGLPVEACQLVDSSDREAVRQMLQQEAWIDVIIPRGGEGLIREVVNTSRIPVIKQYKGVCHTFVNSDADLEAAERIVINAKCQRPGTCNAMETLLIHESLTGTFLPRIVAALERNGVEIRGCARTVAALPHVIPATGEDWDTEYLDLILSVRVVTDVGEAIDHINTHGSGHSEAILTRDIDAARRFQREVDAACVYVNASTRLTDGQQFGFGAEVGISTGKLHSRGPMGLRDLTTRKYLLWGEGTVRV